MWGLYSFLVAGFPILIAALLWVSLFFRRRRMRQFQVNHFPSSASSSVASTHWDGAYRNVGNWGSEATMAPQKQPSRPLGRFLISMRSFLRPGKRRASRTNSSTKGHRLITYGQRLSGTGNKNERPPRTRPFRSPGAIAFRRLASISPAPPATFRESR